MKWRSLSTKLLISSLSVTFVTLVGLSFVITQLLGHYYLNKKKEFLLVHAQEANQFFADYLDDKESLSSLQDHLNDKDHLLSVKVFVAGTGAFQEKLAAFRDPEKNEISQEVSDRVRNGERVFYFITPPGKSNENKIISLAAPMVVDGKIQGIMSLHAPLYDWVDFLPGVYRIIWYAALFALIMAFLLTLWLSKKVNRGLSELSTAAMEIAGGSFQKQVPVRSKDELGQLASAFNFMAQELDKLEVVRQEFIANVSHELRSPLTSLRGFLQAILDHTVPQEQREHYLSIAFEETNRLTRLVNELLDMASMQSTDFSLKLTEINLNELVRRVLAKMERQIVARELEVVVSLTEPDPLIDADWDRLEQVMVNLVDNAVAFSANGGKLSISTYLEGKSVRVTVSDTGIGIPAEELHNIWKRFHKVDKVRSRSGLGTGLGLAIVKRLVEAHGGTITAESELGRGTTISFLLPAKTA